MWWRMMLWALPARKLRPATSGSASGYWILSATFRIRFSRAGHGGERIERATKGDQ
jgi:hypothetical protein